MPIRPRTPRPRFEHDLLLRLEDGRVIVVPSAEYLNPQNVFKPDLIRRRRVKYIKPT